MDADRTPDELHAADLAGQSLKPYEHFRLEQARTAGTLRDNITAADYVSAHLNDVPDMFKENRRQTLRQLEAVESWQMAAATSASIASAEADAAVRGRGGGSESKENAFADVPTNGVFDITDCIHRAKSWTDEMEFYAKQQYKMSGALDPVLNRQLKRMPRLDPGRHNDGYDNDDSDDDSSDDYDDSDAFSGVQSNQGEEEEEEEVAELSDCNATDSSDESSKQEADWNEADIDDNNEDGGVKLIDYDP